MSSYAIHRSLTALAFLVVGCTDKSATTFPGSGGSNMGPNGTGLTTTTTTEIPSFGGGNAIGQVGGAPSTLKGTVSGGGLKATGGGTGIAGGSGASTGGQ